MHITSYYHKSPRSPKGHWGYVDPREGGRYGWVSTRGDQLMVVPHMTNMLHVAARTDYEGRVTIAGRKVYVVTQNTTTVFDRRNVTVMYDDGGLPRFL